MRETLLLNIISRDLHWKQTHELKSSVHPFKYSFPCIALFTTSIIAALALFFFLN